VVICGRPNVGKSSLLNAILRQERAIVTSIPGTTRDTIEETVNIQGVAVKLVDTAGILIPKGLLEEKAVERAKQHIRLADVAMLVFDGSKRLTLADVGMIRRVKQKKVIAVINKIDLKQRIDKIRIEKAFPVVLSVSAKHGRNIPELENAIFRLIGNDAIATSESVMVTNARHIDKLRSAQKYIAQALNSLDNNLSVEFVAQDIKYALRSLDEIIGRGFSEELLDRIFRQFCIGK
jgi:tRNA modification GTPase